MIGDNIKKIRELKNYTQAYMADKLKMSISGYSKIENDRTDISISRINAIAEILETDIASILNFDATNIFYQTNNTNSVITGFNHNQNINNNVENILSRIQDDLNELKNSLNKTS